jgi:adenylate cyclase
MFVLVVNQDGTPQRYPLAQGRSVVGRAQTCDIVINDHSISREHATLVVRGHSVELSDLESRNGTLHNGSTVRQTALAAGDRLMFGDVEAVLEQSGDNDASRNAGASHDRNSTVSMPPGVTRSIEDAPGTHTSHAEPIDAHRVIRLLGDIARTLIATLPLPEILNRVLDLLLTHLKAERASLLMADLGSGELEAGLVRRSDGRQAEEAIISRTLIDLTLAQRAAILTCDVHTDSRFESAHSIYKSDIRSLICGPLYEGERIIGVLYVDNPVTRQFSAADLELFTALANYAAVAIGQARLAQRLAEESRRRERLERYHSPAVVERVLARRDLDDQFAAHEVDISVLFVDVVGFTTIAESLPPTEIAAMLNAFFSRMTDEVFAQEGTVDKFIGDAILAVFGAPVEQRDHARRAVRAAQAMRRALHEMNTSGALPNLKLRYAINSGVAIAGDVGSNKRRDYTVLGDVVNTAARLETIAQPNQIVISRATYDRIQPPIAATSLGKVPLRGRTGKVEILSVEPEGA